MKIVIIGSGNVATQLGKNLLKCGFCIPQIFSRKDNSAKELASLLGCEWTSNPAKIKKDADVYIIAVSDKAIVDVAAHLTTNNAPVFHTSGSNRMEILEKCSSNYGVLYPLQTFSKKHDVSFSDVPLCIEANNEKTMKTLNNIAEKLSGKIYKIDFEKRIYLHVAGVFVNNFTNFMYTLAEDLIDKKAIDFEILKPLIAETAKKILKDKAADLQTGPAIRNDNLTIDAHINLLNDFPDLQKIYSFVTESIQDYHKTKN